MMKTKIKSGVVYYNGERVNLPKVKKYAAISYVVDEQKKQIENAAYEIVCKMIDSGFVESEPEGIDWEHTISEIVMKHLNITE